MSAIPQRRRRWPWIAGVAIIGAALAAWWYFGDSRNQESKAASRPSTTLVVTARAESRDVPVRIRANGTVTALQSVDFRPQVTSTIAQVHIREGQNVKAGELLFSLDAREAEANVKKAAAQIEKDKADLSTAMRNLERQQELFRQKFIAQAALDTVQNSVDTLKGQLAVDSAAYDAARVARAYTEIRATFAGRTGIINVRPGSLVTPSNTVLVTVTQIDPIAVQFTVPEKDLPALRAAIAGGDVPVSASVKDGPQAAFKGIVTFVDNTVDPATGTIKVKAEFDNRNAQLWPGMYLNVDIAPRILRNATVVPAQAVQTGVDKRFVFVVNGESKAVAQPVNVAYIEEGFAAVEGLEAGARVVVEGAQNLRPGAAVTEAQREGEKGGAPTGGKGEGKGEGRKARKAS